jgi:hypothetical protein
VILHKPTDDPAVADQRVSDALESVVANPSERAFVLVAVQMAIKARKVPRLGDSS